jgi:hypothetical protein
LAAAGTRLGSPWHSEFCWNITCRAVRSCMLLKQCLLHGVKHPEYPTLTNRWESSVHSLFDCISIWHVFFPCPFDNGPF